MQKVNNNAQSAVLGAILDNPTEVVRQVIDAHMNVSLFTSAKVNLMLERVWQNPQFVNCPAHMVSHILYMLIRHLFVCMHILMFVLSYGWCIFVF